VSATSRSSTPGIPSLEVLATPLLPVEQALAPVLMVLAHALPLAFLLPREITGVAAAAVSVPEVPVPVVVVVVIVFVARAYCQQHSACTSHEVDLPDDLRRADPSFDVEALFARRSVKSRRARFYSARRLASTVLIPMRWHGPCFGTACMTVDLEAVPPASTASGHT
jgi:hypothetical protein